MNALLAWYFVAVWGSGYIATKIGLQYAAPFTFLSLRFAFGLLCLFPIVLLFRPNWPKSGKEYGHLIVAGLLMHAVQLGGSHSSQPLVTAFAVTYLFREKIYPGQWLGVFIGLAGVALVVWHKIDIREVTWGSLLGTLIALAAVTAATLYQRTFAARTDLKAAAVVQFAASLLVLAPLAMVFEGFKVSFSYELLASIAFLVIFASILAVNVLHLLMRRGEATRVASMMYLPPVFAVALELALFGVVPSALSFAGMAVTCAGVAMVVWKGGRRSSISSR